MRKFTVQKLGFLALTQGILRLVASSTADRLDTWQNEVIRLMRTADLSIYSIRL